MVDIDLVLRCQKGEQDAFEQLYKACATRALRTVYSIANRCDLAEDIIQEGFYECYRDIGKLRTPEAFDVWFYKIIVRVCWRVLSHERKTLHDSLDDCETRLKDPQNYFEHIEESPITEAVNQLSFPLRTTMILYYYNDLSVKEIAEVMDCFQNTVKTRLHKGRKKLSEELRKGTGDNLDHKELNDVWKRGANFERE